MSIIFGRWNFDGEPVETGYIDKVRSTLAPYLPDESHSYSGGSVSILYDAFHTTRESRLEPQPLVTRTGSILTWDGRLDNREELLAQLKEPVSRDRADVSIVAAAYEKWETQCFAKLVGDWALSLWDPRNRSLTLARDPIGPRQLYYTFDKSQVTWSTILDPLVLFDGRSFALNEEYIAGWFSFFPAAHLTPYSDIHSVPPASFLRIEARGQTLQKYWTFNPEKRISYRTDAEYEDHFRVVFAESVRRRLRSDAPILAELSGGMDSSSIVCTADALVAHGPTDIPRIDTVSYYDDSEPNWNERPYFTKVEEKRGRKGCHINAREQTSLLPEYDRVRFPATPASAWKASGMHLQFADRLRSEGNRVVLSGFAGDEVLGGVPTPIPELTDLLTRGCLREFSKQIVRWALAKRTPVLHLLGQTARAFLPTGVVAPPHHKRPPAWLYPHFVKENRSALSGYETRLRLFGPLPTFQENLATLDGLRRQLACFVLPSDPPHEQRYPFLDRDLLEFVYAIPREQLLRPGQRRSLMRRALIGIVPGEILNRKRKAFVTRGPRVAISSEWDLLLQMTHHMVTESLRIVDPNLFREALENLRHDSEAQIMALRRTVIIEKWLTRLAYWGTSCAVRSTANDPQAGYRPDDFPLPVRGSFLSAENNPNTERR
ncbi:MAG: asparagine synthase-related protein [Candidatus Acidiferrum sp.]